MKKNFFYSALSNFFRIVSGVLLFFVFARIFSVAVFGELTYAISISLIVLVIVDYGYLLSIPKEASQDKLKTNELIASAIVVKMILAVGAFSLVYLLHWQGLVSGQLQNLFIFGLAAVFMSFATLFLLPFRTINQFQVESRYTLIYNIMLGTSGLVLAVYTGDIFYVGLGFLTSRVIFLILTYRAFQRTFEFRMQFKRQYLHDLRIIAPFAFFSFISTLLMQLDTLILNYYSGYYSVGIYQAGLRFLVAATFVLSVFHDVLLPKFSALYRDQDRLFVRTVVNYNWILWAISLLSLAVILLLDDWLVLIAYGTGMADLVQYMPLFAIIICLRFINVGYSILLTCSGRQRDRNYAIVVTFLVVVTLDFLLIPRFDVTGALASVIIGNIVLNIGCIWATYREFGRLFFLPSKMAVAE